MFFEAEGRVAVEIDDDGIAHVRLTRGEKMNALDPAMFEAIIDAGHKLAQESSVRVVVISGEGRAFCAGLDLASMGQGDSTTRDLIERTHGNANRPQEAAMIWRKVPVPVIAALHGVCFGGGLQIASGADIRFAHPETRMAIMELKWGLVPDMGGYHLWRGLVRADMLRELVYTNREFSGAEAGELGLATHVTENPLDDALALARTIADRNPHAIRAAKRLHDAMQEVGGDDILMRESVEQQAIIGTPNQMEAVMAGMAKRKATYVDA